MIPYFELTQFNLGGLSIKVWGLLAAAGFAAGFLISYFKVKKQNLSVDILADFYLWLVVAVLVFSRIFYVLFGGELGFFLKKPWMILATWHGGMMSAGGFFGAALAIILYYRLSFRSKRNPHLSFRPERSEAEKSLWPYLDILAFSFPFGWLFGRLACFVMHEHPGRLTNSFFAVNFPGGARYDMGLLELIVTLVLAVIFPLFSRQKQSLGFYPVFLLIWYGVTRFLLDFLRAADLPNSDPRYFSLTLAQWGSLVLIVTGYFIYRYFKKRKSMV